MVDATTPLARLIDISAVQARHTEADVRDLAEVARRGGYVNAHVLPGWVPLLAELLAGSDTLVGAPVGFPSGGTATDVKRVEARWLLDHGVGELDVVCNVGRLRSGDVDYVREDLAAVTEVVAGQVPVKVILETAYLDDAQLEQGCEAAIAAGADFVKTGTGWSGVPTDLDLVRRIAATVDGRVGIKASGGIRDLATVDAMRAAGVTRFGVNVEVAQRLVREAAEREVGA